MTYETLPPLAGGGMAINQVSIPSASSPVKTGVRIRTRFVLAEVKIRPSGWVHVNYDVTIEIEERRQAGIDRPLADVIAPKEQPA